MAYSCKILADSVNVAGCRLTTMEITYPRFVHSEFMTHRMFSRNSASSRAIPIQKMIERVLRDPVMPVWWGKNQSGMQAEEELTGGYRARAEHEWLTARDNAVDTVENLMKIGLHKQISNRILEPWMWITVIVSATDWRNFFELRCHPAAQPEIRKIAEMMSMVFDSGSPTVVEPGFWHMPLMPDLKELSECSSLPMISAGRCARVSYLTHEGNRDPKADEDLAKKLSCSNPGHWSPFEHVAAALDSNARVRNFRGWQQLRDIIDCTSQEVK